MASPYLRSKTTHFGGSSHIDLFTLREDIQNDPAILGSFAIDKVASSNDQIRIYTTPDLSAAAEAAMDAVISSHRLRVAKLEKHNEIDERTEELIVTSGFSHAAAPGKMFSTSANAQSKWHAIMNLGQLGQLTYPVSINAKDESTYNIVDLVDLTAMYQSLVTTGKAHHDSGKALKDTVFVASTIAEVEAVIDNR